MSDENREPNPNLTAALRESLRLEEEGTSPLAEATTDSVDEFLSRIDQHLIDGVPEKITDESLDRLADIYRAKALLWEQEQEKKKSTPREKKEKPQSFNAGIELDFN